MWRNDLWLSQNNFSFLSFFLNVKTLERPNHIPLSSQLQRTCLEINCLFSESGKKKGKKQKKLFSYLACWQGLREEFYKFNCQYTICFCCSFKPPSSNCVFNRWQKPYVPCGHCKIITIKTWVIIMKHTWCTKSAVWIGCSFCRKSVHILSWETISEALHGMPGAVATSLGRAALLS